MKNYTITVNGNVYDVTVEETGVASAPVVARAATPVAQAPKTAAPVATGSEGSIKVNAPMPGKILAVKSKVGDSVKKGDAIIVLEAMKMENEIVAPQDGVIASINTKEGATVEAGDMLASLN
ncbi:MAG: biotin/lipoyl-binding protein [Lachnospiraceae bacterium]|nr:biotin/lipoyl-binding protein [Lachnospiraceae bacterium]MBQ4068139.1 biotin/lipoyl-binding protein [Lachnospiraceae bacterium]